MTKKSNRNLTVLLVLAMFLSVGKINRVYATEEGSLPQESEMPPTQELPPQESEAPPTQDTPFSQEVETMPTEDDLAPVEKVTVLTENKEIISVVLPVVEERNPFSFFIDPLHIFYNTFGSSGGDIMVEEGTCLLFHNRDEGEYTLSSRSDSLNIINQSTVPVKVTITAKLENIEGISMMQANEFENRESCDLYLAFVDNEGNEQPLSEDGVVTVTVYLDRALSDAYIYMFHEDTGEYQYISQIGDVVFDTYSFGLVGACNENGDWTGINGKPYVTVSWEVEPIVPEGLEIDKESDEEIKDVPGEGISGDISDKDGQNTEEQTVGSTEADEESTEGTAAGAGSTTPEPDTSGDEVNAEDSDSGGSDAEKEESDKDNSASESSVTEESGSVSETLNEGSLQEPEGQENEAEEGISTANQEVH